jgi:hypothetical protein
MLECDNVMSGQGCHTLQGTVVDEWNNGGIVIAKENKKFGKKKSVSLPLHPPRFSDGVA